MNPIRYVVAVAGPVGAGKTSLVKAVAQTLVDATMVCYDDYETATRMSAGDLTRWIDQGASFDAFATPRLAADLNRLKQGLPVGDRSTATGIAPAKYILFDTPLGREHPDTGGGIDLLVWLETPLDIALARKLKQFTGIFVGRSEASDAHHFVGWLDTYLSGYLEAVGRVLAIQQQRVRAGADIVLDGLRPLPDLVEQTVARIRDQLP